MDLNDPQTEEELTLALAAIAKEEEEARLAVEDDKAERDAIAKAEREAEEAYRALIMQLKHKKNALDELKWDKTKALRAAQQKRESLERRLQHAKVAAEQKAQWETLEARWDRGTMTAPWREWAKDHQIEGAKKITYEGGLILGDTMGLGKTLTSFIALDMIQVATKEASYDNPIEFGSMK